MNGDDLVEFEKENIDTLQEELLMQYTQRELLEFILNNSLAMDEFIEAHEDAWRQTIENGWDNRGGDDR